MPVFPFPSSKTSILHLEEMHNLVEEKKTRRKDLNIFVLTSDGYKEKNEISELNIFFMLLAKNINNPIIPKRFQLAIENQRHWFSVDCYIKNHQIYLLILDAAVLYRSTEIIKNATLNLKPIIFSYNGMTIQHDFERCSFFTLDHLFRLSNRDQHWNDLIEFNFLAPENVIYLNHKTCPTSLAFIFKNLQSTKGFNKLSYLLKTTVINKKQKTLEQVINENTSSDIFLGIKDTLINKGIMFKEKKYIRRGANFFNLNQDNSTISSRQGFEIIDKKLGKLLNTAINHSETICFELLIENEHIIKNNIRLILDCIIYYELESFLTFLIDTEFLPKIFVTTSDICSLVNKNFNMFKGILEYTMNRFNYSDIYEIKDKIDLYANTQIKEYFSLLFPEDSYSYNYCPAF